MNHHKKERKLKEAIKLQDQLNEIWKAQRDTPAVPLDQPIRSGWKRFFVVKDEFRGRNDIRALQGLVDRLNTVVVCRNRDFKRKDWQTKRLVDIQQYLRVLSADEYENLSPKHFQRFFVECTECQRTNGKHGCSVELFGRRQHWRMKHYRFDAYHMLEKRVKPNYLTHVHVVDGDAESAKRRIYNRMDNKRYWQLLSHHNGHSDTWDRFELPRVEMIGRLKAKEQLNESVD